MGTNRRYPQRTAELIDRRIEQIAGSGSPIGLTDLELEKQRYQVTIAAPAIAVHAWLRFSTGARQVAGFAIAWTPRHVLIEWDDAGTRRELWVWASAVERQSPPLT